VTETRKTTKTEFIPFSLIRAQRHSNFPDKLPASKVNFASEFKMWRWIVWSLVLALGVYILLFRLSV